VHLQVEPYDLSVYVIDQPAEEARIAAVRNGRGCLGDHQLSRADQAIPYAYPGEVAEFDTHTPHWFGSADHHPVERLILFGRNANARTAAPASAPQRRRDSAPKP
jgi:hypothetical protein